MASIFRPKFTKLDKATGKRRTFKTKKWYVQLRDANGKIRRIPGYADKESTRQLAAQLERQAERQQVGLADPYELFRKAPVADHVEAFRDFLTNKGNTPE